MEYQWPDGERPAEAFPPSDLIRDEMRARGLRSLNLGLPPSITDRIVTGSIPVTPEIADLLATALGGDAVTWLNLQARWDAWWPEALEQALDEREAKAK